MHAPTKPEISYCCSMLCRLHPDMCKVKARILSASFVSKPMSADHLQHNALVHLYGGLCIHVT